MAIDFQSKRRFKNFQVRKVREALPEYFTSEFPTLVTFLEKYYEFLDSADATHAFDGDLKQLYATKDIGEMPSDLINTYIPELAGGLETAENFSDTRYGLRRLAQFLRQKGTRFSLEEFFRLFFQQTAEVEYGKESMFIIGDSASTVGPESLKFIQDNALYQTFGLKIVTTTDNSNWNALYKKFVHPAGFYYEGQVISDAEGILTLSAPISIVDSEQPRYVGEATIGVIAPFTQHTSLITLGDSEVRADLTQLISDYQSFTLSQLNVSYHNVYEIVHPNSFTFDDSDIGDSAGSARPDFSLSTETMDNDMFTRYLSDSSF
jgi:hypothetical protein